MLRLANHICRTPIGAALLAIALAGGACTGGGDATAPATTAPPGVASPAGPEAAVTAFERAAAMLLTDDDVADTWIARPSGTPRDPTAPLDDCLSNDQIVEATLATAESLELTLEASEAQRLVASSATVLRDEDGARRVLALARHDDFAGCFLATFEEGIREETGDAFAIESRAERGADPELGDESVSIRGFVTVSDPQTSGSFEAFVHVVAIRTGDAVALVLGASIFEDLPAGEMDRLSAIVARRMADAASSS